MVHLYQPSPKIIDFGAFIHFMQNYSAGFV